MLHEQTSFEGGANLITNEMQISATSYKWLMNARQRLGYIEPVKKHVEITNAPAGKKQGHIGIGNVHIIFVAGLAYYRVDGQNNWSNIPGFSMDAIAPRYWMLAVPSSNFNFVRKNDPTSANRQIIIDVDFAINGTPASIIVQDNVNQPQIILYNTATQSFYARDTQTYSEWSITTPEYVPIGRQMIFKNGITFIVSRDGKSVNRSVTGRPLDFMVNVDSNGNKLPSEYNGGASSVGFAFDYDEITCLIDSNAVNVFILATARNIRLIAFDYSITIFGEPRFTQAAILEAGIVNQESVVEILGDYAFIDFENIKSFNAVQQVQNEGRNSIFSLQLASILKDVKQSDPCACIFDNYALFYIKTLWGNLIAVYDTLSEKWVSFDITRADKIKQFAFIETVTQTKLYAITDDDELFQFYASDDRELAQLMTRSITPAADPQHKSQHLKPLFRGGSLTGNVSVIEYVDEVLSERLTSDFENVSSGINYPVYPPVIPNTIATIKQDTFTFKDGLVGKKIAFIIQWNTDARLYGFTLSTSEVKRDTSLRQQDKILKETYSL